MRIDSKNIDEIFIASEHVFGKIVIQKLTNHLEKMREENPDFIFSVFKLLKYSKESFNYYVMRKTEVDDPYTPFSNDNLGFDSSLLLYVEIDDLEQLKSRKNEKVSSKGIWASKKDFDNDVEKIYNKNVEKLMKNFEDWKTK